jgi:hypothetical protein
MATARAAPAKDPTPAAPATSDPAGALVARLELERYKSTIKRLTQFGDRRQGTERNRAAIDWIETQLKSYGCATARLRYEYSSSAAHAPSGPAITRSPDAAAGGGRYRGVKTPTGVNTDPMRQSDAKLRALNGQPSVDGPREEVWCTKVGATHPDEMYIVGAHMDGIGWGEAANDDGSGTALVMELARIFSSSDVRTERSIRFVLWNNEETGLDGARAYVEQRAALQGKEDPPGSGRYPEPRWLGMIQHDMELFDHGMPRADGSLPAQQRPEADVNIEFQTRAKFADDAQKLAWALHAANEAYATDYPATVGPHMTNTDSTPFMDLVPAVSVREIERGTGIGAGWDPHWHQPTDLYASFSDADFRLGLNAAQTTLGAVARLAGASLAGSAAPASASAPESRALTNVKGVALAGVRGVRLLDSGTFVVSGAASAARVETFEFLQQPGGGFTLLSATTMSDGSVRVQARYDYDSNWQAIAAVGQGIYGDEPVRVDLQASPGSVAIRVRGTRTAIDKAIRCPEGCFMDLAPSGSPMFVMTRHYDRARGGEQSFQWAAQDLPRPQTSPDNQRATLRLRRELPVKRADGSSLTIRDYEMIERIPMANGGLFVMEFDLWTDDADRPMGYRINKVAGKPPAAPILTFRSGFDEVRAQVVSPPR